MERSVIFHPHIAVQTAEKCEIARHGRNIVAAIVNLNLYPVRRREREIRSDIEHRLRVAALVAAGRFAVYCYRGTFGSAFKAQIVFTGRICRRKIADIEALALAVVLYSVGIRIPGMGQVDGLPLVCTRVAKQPAVVERHRHRQCRQHRQSRQGNEKDSFHDLTSSSPRNDLYAPHTVARADRYFPPYRLSRSRNLSSGRE